VSGTTSPVLELNGITKRFGSVVANNNVNLALQPGEILALLGENGAGKTTLMNILFGHYTADAGSIRVHGKPLANQGTRAAISAGIGMVHQHFTLADNMSVLDNIILGTEPLWQPFSKRHQARQRLQKLIDEAGLRVDLNARVKALSVGERQRVEILKALYRNVDVLILDEPTAVLTPQEVDDLFALLKHMAAHGLSIILISHKLDEVMSISQRIVVLRHGEVVGEAITHDIDRPQLAEMIIGHRVDRPIRRALPMGKPVLTVNDLTVGQRRATKPLLNNISFQVAQQQIVGIAGVSGNGQATLAAVLSGIQHFDSGSITLNAYSFTTTTPQQLTAAGAARIPEDRHQHGVVAALSLWENLMLDDLGKPPCWQHGFMLNRGAAQTRAAQWIDKFDVRSAGVHQPAGLLSGGNMQKLILARNLSRKPTFILANQPSRGLDEGAIARVHELLLEARRDGAAVLLISEDLDELLQLSDQIVVMLDGDLNGPWPTESLDARTLGEHMTSRSAPLRHDGFSQRT